jgi:hypothetical protein
LVEFDNVCQGQSLGPYVHDSISDQQNPFVLIESSDGYSFVVKREVALASGMLKNMLDEDSE